MDEKNSIIFNGSAESVIVARSEVHGVPNSAILVVGKQNSKKEIEIINVIQGEDATALWEMLTIKEDK